MKKQLFKINNIVKAVLVAGFITIATSPVLAGDKAKETVQIEPSISYLGTQNTGALFSVAFDAKAPVSFNLVIRQKNGEELFHHHYESANFAQVYKLVNEEGDPINDLTISLETKGGKTYNYTINSTVSMVKEVEISKL